MGEQGEKTVEDWTQQQLAEPDAEMMTLRVGYIPGRRLGSVELQTHHPVTKVLYSSRVTVNVRPERIEALAAKALVEWLSHMSLRLDQVEPFPDRILEE